MGFGIGLFLLVLGAILAFAVSDPISGVDTEMIGYICLAAGVLALIIAFAMNSRRTRTTHSEVIDHSATGGTAAPAAPVAGTTTRRESIQRTDGL